MNRDWKREYEARLPLLNAFHEWLQPQLEKTMNDSLIKHQQVISRVKSVDSFVEKQLRKNYTNPIEEMTDQVGARAILYFTDSIDEAEPFFSRSFLQISREDKRKDKTEDQFGYQSLQIVFCPKEDFELRSPIEFREIKFELQIRTVLQHAWAEIEQSYAPIWCMAGKKR